jgi:hypothetical protein
MPERVSFGNFQMDYYFIITLHNNIPDTQAYVTLTACIASEFTTPKESKESHCAHAFQDCIIIGTENPFP